MVNYKQTLFIIEITGHCVLATIIFALLLNGTNITCSRIEPSTLVTSFDAEPHGVMSGFSLVTNQYEASLATAFALQIILPLYRYLVR